MGWRVANSLLVIITSAVMSVSGFGVDTLQWWIVVLCMTFANIFGRLQEESK